MPQIADVIRLRTLRDRGLRLPPFLSRRAERSSEFASECRDHRCVAGLAHRLLDAFANVVAKTAGGKRGDCRRGEITTPVGHDIQQKITGLGQRRSSARKDDRAAEVYRDLGSPKSAHYGERHGASRFGQRTDSFERDAVSRRTQEPLDESRRLVRRARQQHPEALAQNLGFGITRERLDTHDEHALVPADLSNLAGITFDVLNAAASWDFAVPESKAVQTVAIRSRLSVNTAEAAIDAAMAGSGITRVLSYQVARPVAEDRLRIVLTAFEFPPLPVSLVHAPGMMPLKLRAFRDFAAPRLREVLAAR